MSSAKTRGRISRGNCRIHGAGCEVADGIGPVDRADEKREAEADIDAQLRDIDDDSE